MIPHIEKEYKMMLTQTEYERILDDYGIEPFLQRNFYYATGQKDKTARIRFIDNKYLFTLKVSKNGYKEEYEFEINDNSLDDERIQKLFKDFEIENIEYQGYMDTYRAIVNVENGELCIDKSIYNSHIDYEIEYELKNPSIDTLDVLVKILKKYNLEYKRSEKSKYKRFLDSNKYASN